MSNHRKLNSLNNSKSIVKAYKGAKEFSHLRQEHNLVQKERFQTSTDRLIQVNNFGFDRTANFRIKEQFVRNIILQIKLSDAGTCVLKPNWQNLLISRITSRAVGGETDTYKSGHTNFIETMRGVPDDKIKARYQEISEGDKSLTNPGTITGYVLLNVCYSHINRKVSKHFPGYQLSQALEFDIDFNTMAYIVASGTCVFNNCKVIMEYSDVDSNTALRSVEQHNHYEAISYNANLNSSTERVIKLTSIPTSEICEIIFSVTLTSDDNIYKTQSCTEIKLFMSDKEIVWSRDNVSEILDICEHHTPNEYLLGGVVQKYYVLRFSPDYVRQIEDLMHSEGIVCSEDDLTLSFTTPTNGAARIFYTAIKKKIDVFSNYQMNTLY